MDSRALLEVVRGEPFDRALSEGLVLGKGSYVADLQLEDCLEAGFARSWAAHGVINRVEVGEAARLPGVVGAFSAADLPDLPPTPPPPLDVLPAGLTRPSLPLSRVRYVGEPVAVVLAPDRYVAEDGVEFIEIDIDPLDAIVDPREGARDDAPQLFEGFSNVILDRTVGNSADELESAFSSASVAVDLEIRNERVSPTALEGRAMLVSPEGNAITVFCSHQAPHRLRAALAHALSLDVNDVRVIVPNVGGAFGQKSHTFPEYVVIAYLAMKLQRPVRWIEDRHESFIASTHGRGQSQSIRLAADDSGRLLALDAVLDADVGAYPHTGAMVPLFTSLVMSGPYRVPIMSVRTRAVVTNTCPTAPYRGAGRPEAAYAIERAMDVLAAELELDPAELRLRNFITSDELPYRTPTGALYDSGDYAEVFRKALEASDYWHTRATQGRLSGRRIGIGLCSYIERSGGQSGSTEFGEVEPLADGRVVVRSGSVTGGQNHQDAMAKIVGSILDIDPGRVHLQQGDTAHIRAGTGTFASRTTQVGGAAAKEAASQVLQDAAKRAGDKLEADRDDLVYEGGCFSVRGAPGRNVSLFDLAAEAPLLAAHEFVAEQAFPYGTYVAVVSLDGDTGRVKIERLVAVEDCGVVIDHVSAEGQILGSIAQGIGQALYEVCVYDDLGQPLTASMMDYLLPTAGEVPSPELAHVETPNPSSSVGAKGIGEAGCIGAPPAIANAVADALQTGKNRLDLPLTPERVWRLSSLARS